MEIFQMKLLKILAVLNLLCFSHQTIPVIVGISEWVSPNGTKVRLLGDIHLPSPLANQQVEDFVNHLEKKDDYCLVLTEDFADVYIKAAGKGIVKFDQDQLKGSFLGNITGKLSAKNIAAGNIDFRQMLYLGEGYSQNVEYWNKETLSENSTLWRKVFDMILLVPSSIFEQELKNLKSTYEDHIAKFDYLKTDDEIYEWSKEYWHLDLALFDFVCLTQILFNDHSELLKLLKFDQPKTLYLTVGYSHKCFLEDTLQKLGYKQTYPEYGYKTKKIAAFQDRVVHQTISDVDSLAINIKETLEKLDNTVSITSAAQTA